MIIFSWKFNQMDSDENIRAINDQFYQNFMSLQCVTNIAMFKTSFIASSFDNCGDGR